MKVEIKVPAMGESISSATVGAILKTSGSKVVADEEILELETDKVNQILYALSAGKISWLVATGEVVKIGQTLGHIETDSTPDPAILASNKSESSEKASSVPPILPKPAPGGKSAEQATRFTKESFIADLQKENSPRPLPMKPPLAKKEEAQIEKPLETRRKMSKLRRVIAERLVQVQQTTASLTTFNEVDMSQVLLLREKYKDLFAERYGVRLGFMSFFVKAVVSALQKFPDFNSYIEGDEIIHREYYDIGVAVGTEKGVFVPVLRHVDRLSYNEIEETIIIFAKKAKEGKIAADDLQNGGFTITNGGVYGSLLSTPILNPPQCAILGMHKIEKRAVVIDDQLAIRPCMYLALTYDHRIVDGKEAVSFLVHIKNMLEDPSRQVLNV